jgi:signal transduction histidine kinase
MVLVLAAAGAFVYLHLRSELTESVDAALRARADDFAATPRGAPGPEPEERFAQLLTPAGQLVERTGGPRASALTPREAGQATDEPRLRERRIDGIEGTARMLERRVSVHGRPRVVVTGASLEDRAETLSGLVTSFAIGGPIAVLAACGLGYLLAGAGLAPVEAMRQRAERVSLEQAGERLPLPAADDELRRLGETLNDMLARLEASFERERRFVADASHELRTPLAVQKTELESALRRADDNAERRAALLAALEETDHLAQLADDLLLLAQAGEGRLSVRPETVDVRELLEQARERFADRAREHGRQISVKAPNGMTARVDPLRLRQALGNLVDNALRHGAGDIDLGGHGVDGGVEFEVADRGPGFPHELTSQAFERFARGDRARAGGGAGLGLAIVLAIAEAHGGTATISDRDGQGAAVALRVPA